MLFHFLETRTSANGLSGMTSAKEDGQEVDDERSADGNGQITATDQGHASL
ncbi:uncharacterized protein METZ01_LOCUS278777 [marine metagenome]|uniref:Uncharacterized protein n=1 Tax=marine metagenome TaxID=408172 RepID=A0A382KR37_9ZZZZ